MCGIVALVERQGPSADAAAVLARMCGTLVHRGPDDAGVWASDDGTVLLGHRRLAIVDLSPLGRNPMSSRDGRYWITFNGEIYNFRALRSELIAAGYEFTSQTDTEVVLAAYDRWGVDCLQRFVGMFAFALWDVTRKQMVLARDRLGKKPLYYAGYDGRISIASELKAIVADPRFPRVVDSRAVGLYLRYGYVPAPFSIYAHASKLPPGHYAIVRGGEVRSFRYWDPIPFALAERPVEADAATEKLEELLRDAVGLRMLADVPVGAFLSGGIDSSLVVALMQEQSRSSVETFTIRFDDPQYDEADYAAAVARHLKTAHHEETCDAQQMLDVVDSMAEAFDEPFADSSAIPTYLVSRIARRRVTVALSGDGGDELFFGYPRYRHYMNAGWMLAAPGPIRRAAAAIVGAVPRRRFRRAADVLRLDGADKYDRFTTWWSDQDARRITHGSVEPHPAYADVHERIAGLAREVQPPLIDLVSYLPDDILTKVDRASMQVSLETRSPLLDHRVVEFALGLPLALKWRNGSSKWLLRRLLARRVPAALFERPKMGFGVPIASWLRGPLRARAERLFQSKHLETVGIDPARAGAAWRGFVTGGPERADQIWSLFALGLWVERWQPEPATAAELTQPA